MHTALQSTNITPGCVCFCVLSVGLKSVVSCFGREEGAVGAGFGHCLAGLARVGLARVCFVVGFAVRACCNIGFLLVQSVE